MHNTRNQSGQVGIIIILIMVVLLTFGLSIASRSTREVALSQQEEESNRVFNAAEAGVERALATDLNFQGESFDSGATIIPGTDSDLNYLITKNRVLETRLIEGATAMVQMQDTTNALPSHVYIDWSRATDCNSSTDKPASLIVSVYNITASTSATVRHLAYAGCNRNDDISLGESGQNGYYRRADRLSYRTQLFTYLRG
jgi:type II secretory pathway pseudopilin PulG